MKFFHLADLHLGRKLLGESLIEEQSYILEEIMKNVRVEKPDGIFICGDIYDKYIPARQLSFWMQRYRSIPESDFYF